jgi:O-antigen ligase
VRSVAAVPGPPAAAGVPAWLLLGILLLGGVFYAAVSAGGPWPFSAVVLLLVAGTFVVVLRRPHVGIFVFLTTFLINYPAAARGAGPFTINNLLGALLLVLLLWEVYQRREVWYAREPLLHALLVIGAVFLLGTVAAEYLLPDQYVQRSITKPIGVAYAKTDYTGRFMFQYFSRVAFVVFILQFVRTPRQLWWVFLVLLGCILAAVPPALSTYAQSEAAEVRALTRVVNWADNANRFAFGLITAISFLYYVGLRSRSAGAKAVGLLGAVALLPVVLLSASRSGFLGALFLAFLVLVGAFEARGEGRRGYTVAAVGVLAAVGALTFFLVLPAPLQERVLNVNPFQSEGREGSQSTEYRTATLRNSVDIIRMYPVFGVGLGNFRWVHKHYHGRFKPPHNSYVWALAEGGVPLLVAYGALFVLLWRRLGRLCREYVRHEALPFFPQWLRVYLILFLFFSFFADVWIEEHIFLLVAATILLDRWRATPGAAVPVLARAA